MVGGFSYGDWQVEQIPLIGAVSSSTLSSTPTESITLTKAGDSNPFITGAGVTSTLPGNNLTLAQQMALAEATGTPLTFANQSATEAVGSSYSFTLDLSGASLTDTVIQLALTGGQNNYVCTGSSEIKFDSNGNATITIPAGQDSVTLTLIDGNNVNSADLLTLNATLTNADGTISKSLNNLTITFTDPAPTAANGKVIVPTTQNVTINSVTTPVTVYNGDGSNDQISAVALTSNGKVSINGGGGNDLIIGNGTQDVIFGGSGNDQIYGNTQITVAAAIAQQSTAVATGQKGDLIGVGDGNNTIIGSNGNDDIFTGVGNNTIVCGAGSTFLLGGVDIYSALFGGSQSSMNWSQSLVNGVWQLVDIYGQVTPFTTPTPYYGNLFGGYAVDGGNDTIYGGTGNSVYGLSNGNNWLDAGGGNDLIQAGVGINIIYAGIGNDTITGGGGSNYINLESGNDIVALYGGKQTVIGGTGNDTVYAGDSTSNWANSIPTGTNDIQGGSGNNIIYGSGGNDSLISGSVSGTGKVTTIDAGNGNEYIEGGAGNDTIFGGTGINTIYAGAGNNNIQLSTSSSENSSVYGGSGNYTIVGGAGTNFIGMGNGNTVVQLSSTAGETSTVYGGGGNDSISAANDFEWRMVA